MLEEMSGVKDVDMNCSINLVIVIGFVDFMKVFCCVKKIKFKLEFYGNNIYINCISYVIECIDFVIFFFVSLYYIMNFMIWILGYLDCYLEYYLECYLMLLQFVWVNLYGWWGMNWLNLFG